MSKRVKTSEHNKVSKAGTAWDTALKSNDLYRELGLACAKTGRIGESDGFTSKRRLAFEGGLLLRKSTSTHHVVSSRDFSTSKVIDVYSTGDHHEPIQEANDASRLINQRRTELALAQAFIDQTEDVPLRAYMLTVTVPNCDQGDLAGTVSALSSNLSALMKAVKDSQKRHGRFYATALDGGRADIYGSLISQEITVNPDRLKKCDAHGLFHPHAHLILLTVDDLDIDQTKADFFAKWQSLNSGFSLSRDAFSLEAVQDL